MKMKNISDIKTKEEARQIAIEWQKWQSTKSMFYFELYQWSEYFFKLAEKFNLIYEFKENGII